MKGILKKWQKQKYWNYYIRNKTSVPVFYCRIKYKYEFECVWIKSQGL